MPPLAAAIGGAATLLGTTGLGTILLNTAIGIGVNFAVGLAINAIAGQQHAAAPQPGGYELQTAIGVNYRVRAIFGRDVTGGRLLYENSYGSNNEYLQLVYECGRGEHTEMIGLLVDGASKTLTGSNDDARGRRVVEYIVDGNGNPSAGGTAHMWVKYYTGAAGQAADPELVAHANPASRWPATKKLTATAYAIVTLKLNEKLFGGAPPQFQFAWKGIKAYDRRKDSTQPGGSGDHRWGQPATYEYTENPAVLQDNWRRGLWVNGVRLLGLGVAEFECRHDWIVAAANVCDELVTYADTGRTLSRYSIGTTIEDGADPIAVMRMFETAMAGFGTDIGGAYGPLPGETLTSVMTLTDDDRAGEDVSEVTRLGPDDTKTAYSGLYVSPETNWQQVEYGLRTDEAVEAQEGGRRLGPLDLNFIKSQETAGAVAEIYRRRDRFSAVETAVYGPKTTPLEPGDCVTRVSALMGTYKAIVWEVAELKTMCRRITFRSWDNSIIPTPSAGFLPLPADPIAAPVPARPITVSALLPVAAEQVSGNNRVPAIRVTFTPITDPTVDRVILKYWPVSDPTQVRYQSLDEPGSGIAVIEGVLPETDYRMVATISTTPPRPTIWTNEAAVTTSALVVGSVADGAIDIDALDADVRGLQQWLGAQSVRGLLEEIESLASLVAESGASTTTVIDRLRREASASFGTLTANYREEITTLAGEVDGQLVVMSSRVETLAASIDGKADTLIVDALSTRVDEVDGEITASLDAIKALNGSVDGTAGSATFRMGLTYTPADGWISRTGFENRSDADDDFSAVGLFLESRAGAGRIIMSASQTVIMAPDGTVLGLFDANEGEVWFDKARIRGLDAENIDVVALTGSEGFFDNLTVTWATISDAVINNFVAAAGNIGELSVTRLKIADGAVTDYPSGSGAGGSINPGQILQFWGPDFVVPPGPFIVGGKGSLSIPSGDDPAGTVDLMIQDRTNGSVSYVPGAHAGGSGRSFTLNGLFLMGFLVGGRTYRLGIQVQGDNSGNSPMAYGAWSVQATIPRK